MSDVGLGANLELSITEALRRVDQLGRALDAATAATVTVDTAQVAPAITKAVEAADTGITVAADTTDVTPRITAAVEAADTGIVVDADAADVTGSIDAAVEDANTAVTVTGDASEVTGSIDGAVEAANTHVTVTGDASEITGSIDGAVQAANTNVSVTGSVDNGLQTDVLNLGANIADASAGASKLGGVLAGISVAAAVGAIRALADSASDLNESASKAGVVFGQQFSDIERFANDAAGAVGLSKQAAFEATATFGNLFQALGTSREEAALLSPQVVQLAGDLASFNNLNVDDVLEKLRSGLVGEIEPLRSLGVSFGAAQVEAKALELGLGGVGRELTEGEKVQARYQLILEQTTLAQGDFARTSDGLANQQRILGAELKNAAAAAGTALLPAVLAIVDQLRELVPEFQNVAEDVLPSVSDAIISLTPLLGTTTDLFIALAPVVKIVAEAIAAIPPDAIALAGGLLVANKALGGFAGLFTGIGPALKAFGPLATGAASALGEGAPKVGLFAKGITGLATALASANPLTIAGTIAAVGLYREWQQGQKRAREFDAAVDSLSSSLGKTGSEFETAKAATRAWLDELIAGTNEIKGGVDLIPVSDALNLLGLDAEDAARLLNGGTEAVTRFVDGLGELDRGQKIAAVEFKTLAKEQDAAVKATLSAKAATGQLTDEQERQLDALNDAKAPTLEYTRLLDEVGAAEAAAAEDAAAATEKYGPLADEILGVADAYDRLAESSPTALFAIGSVAGKAKPSAEELLNLALGLDAANLSADQMADAAAQLGVDVDSLTSFVDTAAGAVQDFADTAIGALPTVSSAFKDMNDDGKVSAQEFRDNLDQQAEDLRAFTLRLAALTDAGFGELAGQIAQQGPQIGGELAKQLGDALATGHTKILVETQAALDNFNGAWTDTTAYLRDVLGPKFVLTTGLIGQAATTTFGENLDFGERLRIAGEVAALQMDVSGKAVAAIAATEGADAAQRYGDALDLDQKAIDAAIAAGTAIGRGSPAHTKAVGAARSLGSDMGVGMAQGLDDRNDDVSAHAERLALNAIAAANRAAETGSPSKVMIRLGRDMGSGLVLGLDQSSSAVVAAAEQIVRDASVAVASVSPEVSLAARPGGGSSSANGGPDAGSSLAISFDVTVNPPAGMTPTEARDLGVAIVDGAEERAVERRLSIFTRIV